VIDAVVRDARAAIGRRGARDLRAQPARGAALVGAAVRVDGARAVVEVAGVELARSHERDQ